MPENIKKKHAFLSKIKTREDALKIAKEASVSFFVIAGIQGVTSFFLGYLILFDAFLFVICGLFVLKYNSRIAALILLLIATISMGVTFANKIGANLGGGNNVILAIFMFWAAIRAVEATFKLHGRFSEQSINDNSINHDVE